MILWMLAIVCLGGVGAVGLNRGAIRMAASFVGILAGMLLAPPLGPLFSPIGGLVSKNPVIIQSIGVALAFVLVSVVFKVIGSVIHNKVEVYFKYKAVDTKLVRFERLIKNIGAFVGIMNGALYFFIILLIVYLAGYFTVQAGREGDERSGLVSLINSISKEIDRAEMDQSLAAINPMPKEYFTASDIVGHLVHNRLLISRLTRYPEFLDMSEWPEFQAIANDPRVNELIATGAFGEVASHPKINAVLENQEVIDRVKEVNLEDLRTFIETGVSPQFQGIPILGKWSFSLPRSLEETRQANPGYNARRMQVIERDLGLSLMQAVLTATPDNDVYIKALPAPPPAQPGEVQPLPSGQLKVIARGTWEESRSGIYRIQFDVMESGVFYQTIQGNGQAQASEGILKLELPNAVLVFQKQL